MTTSLDIAASIQEEKYLRERLFPQPADYYYLCLSDLLIALEKLRTDDPVKLLDYGCGGSPYKTLFPNAEYRRADYLQAEGDFLDYILDELSLVNETDGKFDLILSTQVAEHVKSSQTYFSECFRLLKPDGKLICSTHGYFPDHGCPYDFQRWTADGLKRDLELAGFEVNTVYKLTAGARAFFSILDFSSGFFRFFRFNPTEILLFVTKKIFSLLRPLIYRQLDRLRDHERVVIDPDNAYPFYIGLMAVATKRRKES